MEKMRIVKQSRLGAYEVLRKTAAFPSNCWVTLQQGSRYLVEVESAEGFTVYWVDASTLEAALANEDIRLVVEL